MLQNTKDQSNLRDVHVRLRTVDSPGRFKTHQKGCVHRFER